MQNKMLAIFQTVKISDTELYFEFIQIQFQIPAALAASMIHPHIFMGRAKTRREKDVMPLYIRKQSITNERS